MAGGDELQLAINAARAGVQQLRLENWRLSRELRRELSQEACAGQLHCHRMATASKRREADASAGAPPAEPPLPAGPAEGAREAAGAEAARRALEEAEGEGQRLREEVYSLKSGLRDAADLQALKQEVARMRELLAQPEEAWRAAAPPLADAAPADAPLEERGGAAEERPQGGEGGSGVLLAEVSFEMLATIGEAELAEEKRALQREVRHLQRELASPSATPRPGGLVPPPPAADVPSLRQRRRLQQVDAIAQRLHEEFQLRAGPKQSPSVTATGAEGVAAAEEAEVDPYAQALEQKIKSFAQRFALVRDLR